jgi:hypothetical protein
MYAVCSANLELSWLQTGRYQWPAIIVAEIIFVDLTQESVEMIEP